MGCSFLLSTWVGEREREREREREESYLVGEERERKKNKTQKRKKSIFYYGEEERAVGCHGFDYPSTVGPMALVYFDNIIIKFE